MKKKITDYEIYALWKSMLDENDDLLEKKIELFQKVDDEVIEQKMIELLNGLNI